MRLTAHLSRIRTPIHVFPCVLFSFLTLGLFILARRVQGAISSPLPPALLVIIATVFLAAVWITRMLDNFSHRNEVSKNRISLLQGTAILTPFALAIAFSWPMGRLIDWAIWLPIIALEIVHWRTNGTWPEKLKFRRRVISNKNHSLDEAITSNENPASIILPLSNHLENSLAQLDVSTPCESELDEEILQELTRVKDAATGYESIFGTVKTTFAPNDRTLAMHVAFCPPFSVIPEVHAEINSDIDAKVRVTQTLVHGIRLEVQLKKPANEVTSVMVEFSANEPRCENSQQLL